MVSNAQAASILLIIAAIAGGGGFLFFNENQSGDTPEQPSPTTDTPATVNTPTSTSTPSPQETDTGGDSPPTSIPSETPTVEPIPTAPETPSVELSTSSLRSNLKSDIIARQDYPQTAINESMYADTGKAGQLTRMASVHSQRMAKFESVAHSINGSTAQSRYNKYVGPENCGVVSYNGEYILPKTEMEALYAYEFTSGNESTVAQRITDNLFLTPSTRRVLQLEGAQHLGVGVAVRGNIVYIDVSVC